jgi:ribosome-associated protein
MPRSPSPKPAEPTPKRKRAAKPKADGAAPAAAKKRRLAAGPAEERAAKPRAARKPKKPKARAAADVAMAALDDLKAQHVVRLDVRHLTSVTDTMIIASGRSDRHVRSLADAVVERCEEAGLATLGVEGQDAGEWVLVDLGDVVVHVMLPRVREFYNLEKLWGMGQAASAALP